MPGGRPGRRPPPESYMQVRTINEDMSYLEKYLLTYLLLTYLLTLVQVAAPARLKVPAEQKT